VALDEPDQTGADDEFRLAEYFDQTFSTDSSAPEPHSDRGEASLGRPNGHSDCDAHGVTHDVTDGVTD